MQHNLTVSQGRELADDLFDQKARGAFFTPVPIATFLANWAIRNASDTVLEPAAGDAAFLVPTVERLKALSTDPDFVPTVHGVEIHQRSAGEARRRVERVGGSAAIEVADFFEVPPRPIYSAVVGNPPFIRYQQFTGPSRTSARVAALRVGVSLSGLASSWAGFVVHAVQFLEPGGRMAFVLPAELLSVNYAAPVRKFLFDRFGSVELVLFAERVFPEAETEAILLLADGYQEGPSEHATVRQVDNAERLLDDPVAHQWFPRDPSGKWTQSLLPARALEVFARFAFTEGIVNLRSWGRTSLGMVTGNNSFFALSDHRVRELGLSDTDVRPLSPPGSTHLRTTSFTRAAWNDSATRGARRWLFSPHDQPSRAARDYIAAGEIAGVNSAYKCRIRSPWWRIPLSDSPDLFFTYMNADVPRISENRARVHHLNSVHGIRLHNGLHGLGRRALAVASLNSLTLLGAETMGRAYGGGILKLEPREADLIPMPSPELLRRLQPDLARVTPEVDKLVSTRRLEPAIAVVDDIVLNAGLAISAAELEQLRQARVLLSSRRATRSRAS